MQLRLRTAMQYARATAASGSQGGAGGAAMWCKHHLLQADDGAVRAERTERTEGTERCRAD